MYTKLIYCHHTVQEDRLYSTYWLHKSTIEQDTFKVLCEVCVDYQGISQLITGI